MQVSILDWDDTEYVAYYSNFYIHSEAEDYRLSLSGYDSVRSTMPDAFAHGGHNNAPFTTFDRDNDNWANGNCASQYSGGKAIKNICMNNDQCHNYYRKKI